jgi:hypothetical protein
LNRLQKIFARYSLVLGLLVVLSRFMIACSDTTPTVAPILAVSGGTASTTAPATGSASSPTLAPRPGYNPGETKRLGAGLVQSWIKIDEYNKPTAIGLTFSESALLDLPVTANNQLPLSLPAEASTTAFNHISIDWNPQGHEPAGVYDKPHFDIHFYLISPQDRQSISPSGDVAALSKLPSTDAVPQGYIMPPGPPNIVPGQGIHWSDSTAPEFRGQPFTQTFIYGFANAKLDFFEPMITKTYLETKPDFNTDLKLPGSYPKSGVSYPTKMSIKYDAATKEYMIALEGLTMR